MTSLDAYNPLPFAPFKKRLWCGTLLVQAGILIGTAFLRPQWLPLAAIGVGMGLFYLWSLMFNAESPKRGIQGAFSLIRISVMGWLAVRVSHAHPQELVLVMSGLLSYKLMLMVEYVLQALPAFRFQFGQSPSRPHSNGIVRE